MANLFIFSNDLRLEDNPALYNASLDKNGLEALFLFNEKNGNFITKVLSKLGFD